MDNGRLHEPNSFGKLLLQPREDVNDSKLRATSPRTEWLLRRESLWWKWYCLLTRGLPSVNVSAGHKQVVLLPGVRDLHLDPLRDQLVGMPQGRDPLREVLEVLEWPLLPLLEDRPHRLLPETRQELEHMEARRDRLGLVEQADELLLLVLHDLTDHERKLVLRGGREFALPDPALHVHDNVPLVDVLPDVHAIPDGDRGVLLRRQFEEVELVLPHRARDGLPLALLAVPMTLPEAA